MQQSSPTDLSRIRVGIASRQHFPEFVDPTVEHLLTQFERQGYQSLLQADIVSGHHQTVLQSHHNCILSDRFRQAMGWINPTVSRQHTEAILHQLRWPPTAPGLPQNQQWHQKLVAGIPLGSSGDNSSTGRTFRLLDFSNPDNNDWLVIYSFPVLEADYQHCLDLVVFINGLPLVVFHGLHLPAEPWALRAGYLQLREYQAHLPRFFSRNELLVLLDGNQFRIGTLTDGWKQFIPMGSVVGSHSRRTATEDFIQNFFERRRFLKIIQYSIEFRKRRQAFSKSLRFRGFSQIS